MQSCLSKLLLFGKMTFGDERRIAAEMYERSVVAGEILIKEGDTGLSFSCLLPQALIPTCILLCPLQRGPCMRRETNTIVLFTPVRSMHLQVGCQAGYYYTPCP